jgi:hypothetical protein
MRWVLVNFSNSQVGLAAWLLLLIRGVDRPINKIAGEGDLAPIPRLNQSEGVPWI